jgi:tetratricopeptide (TPR) repeat protein
MLKKILLSSILLCQVYNCGLKPSLAEDFTPKNPISSMESFTVGDEKTINLNKTQSFEKFINLNENNDFSHLINATDRFVQCNIKASWDDFKALINAAQPNDFTYISIANKMSDMGLFDLANLASSKIQDKELTKISIGAMKRFYYPRKKLKLEDEMFLAEIYSNILYNDQSSEATSDLLKNTELLATSDYANYLVSLGSYKSNMHSRANKYINIAMLQNPSNLNYQKLKAEILAEENKQDQALKIVETLKKQKLYSYQYEVKIQSLEQYVLYKTKKAQWEKDYHLGYYHYLDNDNSKAIKTLQSAIAASKKKSNHSMVYALMSEIYLKIDETDKASDCAQKAYKINKNNARALTTLGDLSYNSKNYKRALYYYKQASSEDKASDIPLVKEAKTYENMGNTKKAKELYAKVLKTHPDSFQAYYDLALLEKGPLPNQKVGYLKKALAINPLFEDGWLELAKVEMENENYNEAKKYLSNAFCIDENDFRYYYYNGLANKGLGDYNQAQYDFKKCLKMNNKCKEAQEQLQQTFNVNL